MDGNADEAASACGGDRSWSLQKTSDELEKVGAAAERPYPFRVSTTGNSLATELL